MSAISKHPQSQQDQVSQPKLALIGSLAELQESECRKDQVLRLLAHYQVQQDGEAHQHEPAEK